MTEITDPKLLAKRRPLTRSRWSYPTSTLKMTSPSRTKQSAKDECDINLIMSRWAKTGDLSHVNNSRPAYGDFTTATDYLAAVALVDQANEGFSQLPSEVRDRMNNDPAELLEFVHDDENRAEAIELGLIPAPPPAEPPPPSRAEPPAEPPAPPSPAAPPAKTGA